MLILAFKFLFPSWTSVRDQHCALILEWWPVTPKSHLSRSIKGPVVVERGSKEHPLLSVRVPIPKMMVL